MPYRGGGVASVVARCVAVVAWWGAVAGAPGEYGGRMPAYSDEEPAPPDEYGGLAPDAPAPLDYGRYEQHFDKSRERNRHHEDEHVGLEDLVNINDDFPKSTTRFHPKHRTHRRNKGNRKYYMKKYRGRMDDPREPENEEDEVGDNKKSLRSHRERYAYRDTSDRGLRRRRPRDRGTESGKGDEDEGSDGELPSLERSLDKWSLDRELDRIVGKERGPPLDADERLGRPALKEDPAGDYDDYEDIKKTPSRGETTTLVTRPQVRQLVPTPPELRPFGDLGFRRAFSSPRAATSTPTTSQTSPTTTSTITSTTTASASTTVSTTTTAGTTPTVQTPSEKLSLAEKSRLSIMKKAQRKESIREETSSTKPPVFLQVSQKLPTVVMVEPPVSQSWRHAQLVSAESPEHLRLIKRLMRQKLLDGARSLRDLTDDWDSLVCDYIDMGLVAESPADPLRPPLSLLYVVCLLCFYSVKVLFSVLV